MPYNKSSDAFKIYLIILQCIFKAKSLMKILNGIFIKLIRMVAIVVRYRYSSWKDVDLELNNPLMFVNVYISIIIRLTNRHITPPHIIKSVYSVCQKHLKAIIRKIAWKFSIEFFRY